MPKGIKEEPKWKLIILLAVIILTVGVKTNEIQAAQQEEANKGLGTPEIPWDISENGDGSLKAVLSENGILMISGKGKMKDWKRSEEVNWYQKRRQIKKIRIQKGAINIGDYAFEYCTKLTQIDIPEEVTRIGKYAFNYCSSLTQLNIPEGVTKIGDWSFYECYSLKSINIPEGVTQIGYGAFAGCSLTQINIPKTVTEIENSVFLGCSELANIVVDYENQSYMSENGVLFNKERTLLIRYPAGKKDIVQYSVPEKVEKIVYGAFKDCTSLENIDLPKGIKRIEEYTFSDCINLKKINIPEGITTIESHLFSNCHSLTSINIPEGVTKIGTYAFEQCKKLTHINIPEGVTNIQDYTFEYCTSLKQINIPEGITSIEREAFRGCKSLTQINIPEGVTSIEIRAFEECRKLTHINIPEGITNIQYGTFKDCTSLKQINIPEGVTCIEGEAFSRCSRLKNITIPQTVTSIENQAFKGCNSLTSITLPEGMTQIEEEAFSECSSLTDINIPKGVTNIADNAFSKCIIYKTAGEKLKIPEIVKRAMDTSDLLYAEKIKYTNCNINEQSGEIIRINQNEKAEIKIESGKLQGLQYEILKNEWDVSKAQDGSIKAVLTKEGILTISGTGEMKDWDFTLDTNWQLAIEKIVNQIVIEEGITSIGNCAFEGCKNLTQINLPKGVNSIGEWAFNRCSSLTKLDIPEGVTSIEKGTFGECSSLTNITIPERVTSIGEGAFNGCNNLTKLDIPEGVTSIEKGTFGECSSLTNITIPEGVTSIGEWAFNGCSSLTKLNIPEGVTSIGTEAFCNCKNLIIEEIPKSVKEIGENAFYGVKVIQAVDNGQAKEQLLEFPELIKKYNTAKEFTLIGCELNEDKTKIKVNTDTVATKQVELIINSGPLNGLNLLIEIPTGTIAYTTKNTTNQEVIATLYLTENEKIINNEGKNNYTFTENGEFIFEYEDEEQNLQKAKAMVNNIDNIPPKLQITYDKIDATNQNVVATIISNEPLQEMEGWTLSEDKMSLTKQYNNNQTEEIIVADLLGNKTKVTIEVKNIDKIAPSVIVNQNIINATNQNVVATIISNEPLQEIEGWALSEDKMSLTKEYSQNQTEEIILGDLLGNKTKVTIEVKNIDKIAPSVTVSQNITEPTNQKVTVTIKANESLQEIEGWTLSEDKMSITKEYSQNQTEELIIKDLAGNQTKETIKIDNIDNTSQSIQKGDPNNDGKIDSTDVIILLRHIAANSNEQTQKKYQEWLLTGDELKSIDIKEDGKIDSTDTIKLLRYIAAMKSEETRAKNPDWFF